jgi:dipeptidyl aminopeptidase/acylaminoacyl peptidase
MLALTPGDPEFQPGFEGASTKVDACASFYGVYDLTGDRGTSRYDRGLMMLLERSVFKRRAAVDHAAFEGASPLYRVSRNAPPFMVLHGSNDTLVPVSEARRFVEALRARSEAPVLFVELPYAQHAFDILPSVRSAHVVAAVVRFLEGVRARTPGPAIRSQAQPAPDPAGPGQSPAI